jgi:hypothetical protein
VNNINDPLMVEIRDQVNRIRTACGYPSQIQDFGWCVKRGQFQAVRIVFVGMGKSKRTRVEQLTELMPAAELLKWMQDNFHFMHHPSLEDLTGVWIHPVLVPDLWKKIWELARAQPWYEAECFTLLGGDGKHFYFMRRGVAGGIARVTLDPVAEAMQSSVAARARENGVGS